jgi:hypothetical protein
MQGLCTIAERNGAQRISLNDKVFVWHCIEFFWIVFKISLVKHSFTQLALLNHTSKFVLTPKSPDRKTSIVHVQWKDMTASQDENQRLIRPLLALSPSEAEIVLLKAIVAMDPGEIFTIFNCLYPDKSFRSNRHLIGSNDGRRADARSHAGAAV